MRHRLTLLRHAKSSWEDDRLDDSDRPLNERGERDAPLMGRRLRARGARPTLILTSPAVRARRTAQIVAREIGYPAEFLQREEELYLASPDADRGGARPPGQQLQGRGRLRPQSRADRPGKPADRRRNRQRAHLRRRTSSSSTLHGWQHLDGAQGEPAAVRLSEARRQPELTTDPALQPRDSLRRPQTQWK